MDRLDVKLMRQQMERKGLIREEWSKVFDQLERLQDREAAAKAATALDKNVEHRARHLPTETTTQDIAALLAEIDRLSMLHAERGETCQELAAQVNKERQNRADDKTRFERDYQAEKKLLEGQIAANLALAAERDEARMELQNLKGSLGKMKLSTPEPIRMEGIAGEVVTITIKVGR